MINYQPVMCKLISCKRKKSKYKCPRCEIFYCSLPCYKKHNKTACFEKFCEENVTQSFRSLKISETEARQFNKQCRESMKSHQDYTAYTKNEMKLKEFERLYEKMESGCFNFSDIPPNLQQDFLYQLKTAPIQFLIDFPFWRLSTQYSNFSIVCEEKQDKNSYSYQYLFDIAKECGVRVEKVNLEEKMYSNKPNITQNQLDTLIELLETKRAQIFKETLNISITKPKALSIDLFFNTTAAVLVSMFLLRFYSYNLSELNKEVLLGFQSLLCFFDKDSRFVYESFAQLYSDLFYKAKRHYKVKLSDYLLADDIVLVIRSKFLTIELLFVLYEAMLVRLEDMNYLFDKVDKRLSSKHIKSIQRKLLFYIDHIRHYSQDRINSHTSKITLIMRN